MLLALLISCFLAIVIQPEYKTLDEVDCIVECGQTLWGIANKYCPSNMDKRDYIRLVKSRNNIGADCVIHPGQRLIVYQSQD